jgi:uncharacterized protein YjdB
VEWKTSATAVATVDGTGKVTAVKAGTADITVTTKDGAKTATCKVTVNAKVIPVTGVTVSPSSTSLEEGAIQILTANVTPSNATNKEVEWSSSETTVATVDENGRVTARKAGSALIKAKTKDGGHVSYCAVTVKDRVIAVTGVTVDPATLSLEEGDSQTLTATVLPSNAANKAVEWKSSATGIATVDANGKVTAIKAGTADITVTTKDGAKTATCKVTVNAKVIPVTGVSWAQSADEVAIGGRVSFRVTYTPSNATNATYSWKSSNESIAKIDYASGPSANILGVSAGSATITATVGTKSVSKVVSVYSSIYNVELTTKNKTDADYISNQKLHLTVDETYTLEAQALGNSYADKSIKWQSEYSSCVSVSSQGDGKALVKALSPRVSGSTVLPIKVYAISNENPNVKDYIEVYVYSKPTSIYCDALGNDNLKYVKPGDSSTLTFTVSPSTARQGIVAKAVPTANGTWTCSISGLKATVRCPSNPYTEGTTNSRDKFYQAQHLFRFVPIGARNASTPNVEIYMHPCEYYADDVKPLDYIYYNLDTDKLRSGDGGLRNLHNGVSVISVSPKPQSREATSAVITYVGSSIRDNLANLYYNVTSGLSNSSGSHGFAIALFDAANNSKWSDDKDDVASSSNWPVSAGSPTIAGDVWTEEWQNAWSLTEAAVIYNDKVKDSKKIKPIRLRSVYESVYPTSKIEGISHWVVPTFSMGRLGTDKDSKSVFYNISGDGDSGRLDYLNNNLRAAGGNAYTSRCWSINVYNKQYAWTVFSYKDAGNSLVYNDKTSTNAVRLWLVF